MLKLRVCMVHTVVFMVHDLYSDIHSWWLDCNAHLTWCYAGQCSI